MLWSVDPDANIPLLFRIFLIPDALLFARWLMNLIIDANVSRTIILWKLLINYLLLVFLHTLDLIISIFLVYMEII